MRASPPVSRPILVGLCLLFTLLLTAQHAAAVRWIALAHSQQKYWNQTKHCLYSKEKDGLAKNQARLCRQHMELMGVIAHASAETVTVCKDIFTSRRWNCSSIGYAPTLLADLTGGSREQAFVYALSSAALTQGIAKSCSMGITSKCSCGRIPRERPPGDFKWGGCGDDTQFGVAFSKLFADGNRRKKNPSKRIQVNSHNNRAGRRLVEDSLSTACKCHGVSGSCSIKTCWKALPDVKSIGLALQKKYALAVEVANKKKENGKRELVAINRQKRDFSEDELIFYTKSPDYCLPDQSLGSLGTQGRECKKDHTGSGGCRSMCCGRGYTSHVIEMKQRCDCKYYWCCYVKCKTCIKKVEINQCR